MSSPWPAVRWASIGAVLTTFAGSLVGQSGVTEFVIPGGNGPYAITSGPDGALWFTERLVGRIGRVTISASLTGTPFGTDRYLLQSSNLTEYSVPSANSQPTGIANGPDGSLWFTEQSVGKIGRITTTGAITEFPLPSPSSGPVAIAAGPDGCLWFTDQNARKIGRITTSGVITEFAVPSGGSPKWIASGPDGNLWFTEFDSDLDGNVGLPGAGNRVGRITTSGSLVEFDLPTSPPRGPFVITSGPDGNLWFTERASNGIGRITTGGVLVEFLAQQPSSSPFGITRGPDGNLWFAEILGRRIVRITTAGSMTEFPLAGDDPLSAMFVQPYMITTGSDGNLWFTRGAGSISRLILPPPPAVPVPTTRGTVLVFCGILLAGIAASQLRAQ